MPKRSFTFTACFNCVLLPLGDEGGKRERCAKHTENGMVNFNRRR